MGKRKPILIKDEHGLYAEVQWVGPNKPTTRYQSYIRIEDGDGKYVGSLTDRQAKKLRGWLNTYFKVSP